MKKTLILICSLLAVAHADSLTLPSADAKVNGADTLTSSHATITWDVSESTGISRNLTDYALTFSVSGSDAQDRTFMSRGASNGSISGFSVGIKYDADAQTHTLTLSNGKNNWIEGAPALSFTAGATYTLAVFNNVAYLWEGSDFSEARLTGGVNMTGTYTDITSGTLHAWTNGGVNQLTVGTVTDISSVPEPATATLSLLALAGLAARRRRK